MSMRDIVRDLKLIAADVRVGEDIDVARLSASIADVFARRDAVEPDVFRAACRLRDAVPALALASMREYRRDLAGALITGALDAAPY
jgi:hypothetical protein